MQQLGLTAAAQDPPIDPFSFLGFYTGDWSSAESAYRGSNRYVLEVDGCRIIPRLGEAQCRRGLHIIARANEPPFGTRASCAWVHFVKESELRAGGDPRRAITAVRRKTHHAPPSKADAAQSCSICSRC